MQEVTKKTIYVAIVTIIGSITVLLVPLLFN